MFKYLGLLASGGKMGAAPSRQRVRVEEIQTWAEYLSNNRTELVKCVASTDNATLKRYSVDWDINSKVSLYEGNITCIDADGVVCCNNSDLKTTGGISWAIEQAAGKGLTEELAKLNGCKVGETKVTAGYKLPVKYIVHTVGPIDNNEQHLDQCYSSCLEQMKAKHMNSMVFCCISTGSYGFPHDKAADVALKRVRLWLEDRKKKQTIDDIDRIVFCLFTKPDISAYKAWMQVYFPCGSEDDYRQWVTMQEKITNLQPLDGLIEITTEPDMITYDDDPRRKRAKMPCGHVIGPTSMTDYCTGILKEGKYSFPCPDPKCKSEWPYFLVRHVAYLTTSQTQEFEKRIAEHHMRLEEGPQKCPGCGILCARQAKTKNCVKCLFCSKKQGVNYYFCWQCLGTWNVGNGNKCGNTPCPKIDDRLKVLENCPNKMILDKFDAPSVRACPKCGMLIEYLRACTQMPCRACGHFFCFLCLAGAKTKKELKCLPYNSTCKIAPRQTKLPEK